jgi:hypothetical protein
MVHIAFSASEVLLFMASLYGWGSLINRWFHECWPSCLAYPAALGMAGLIAIGGTLNATGLAKQSVLLALLVLGLVMAVITVGRSFLKAKKEKSETTCLKDEPFRDAWGNLLYLAFILIVFLFLVMVLMPTRTFNLHDDFHGYLMWPVRMLQTGSLGGNPFDHLGVSALGGQPFMQALFLTFGKITDINAFDAILCLVLSLVLLRELGELIEVKPVFVIVAGLLAIFINPHYVNISSLYSGSLLLLGLVYAHILLARTLEKPRPATLIRAAAPCALLYAALLTLKTTYILVALSFWGTAFLGSLLLGKEKKQVLPAFLSCAVLTIILLVPWISLYWNSYLREVHYILNDIGYPPDIITAPAVSGDDVNTLFSKEEIIGYGNTYRDYLGIIGMLGAAFASTGWITWKNRTKSLKLIPFLSIFLGTIISYYGLQFLFDPARIVVRYSCPLLIAAAPVAVLITGWLWTQGRNRLHIDFPLQKIALFFGTILLGSQLALIGIFRSTFVDRIQRAYVHRTLLSFPLAQDEIYKQYNDYALGEKGMRRMSFVQKTIPVGETIFAWASMPFLLDFTRNRIYTINESGLVYNLLVMPLAGGPGQMLKFFHQFGIHYIIWDYKSYGMKQAEQMGSLPNDLIDIFNALIPRSKVLYNDGQIIVFDIGRER